MFEEFAAWLATSGARFYPENTCNREQLTETLRRHGIAPSEPFYRLETFFGGISGNIKTCVFYTLETFDDIDCLDTEDTNKVFGVWPHRFWRAQRLIPFGLGETRIYYLTPDGRLLFEDWYLGEMSPVEEEHPMAKVAKRLITEHTSLLANLSLRHNGSLCGEFARGRRN